VRTSPQSKRRSFLSQVDRCEKVVAKILAVVMAVVIAASIVELIVNVLVKLAKPDSATSWLGHSLIKVLGDLLTVLIALEVLQNVTSYLKRHLVQVELVLVTALTAVARKVIVLPASAEDKPALLGGLALATLALAAAYWLVRQPLVIPGVDQLPKTGPTRLPQERDPYAPADDGDRM